MYTHIKVLNVFVGVRYISSGINM